MNYDPAKIEKKWQKKWAKDKIYKSVEKKASAGKGKKGDAGKFYALDMFPYPSGEGLHVGHPKGYIATDIVSRYRRMKGYSVLHPMGFDAFGLPAENYAIKTKTNPADSVAKNVDRYKEQLEILGFDYDWSREVNTTDPAYYKWTQWIFLQLFKKGLAYESYEPVNWCPTDKTVLANEDVENGRCERCGTPVEKKPLRQWVLKITDYADRLLQDLDEWDYSTLPQLVDYKNPHRSGAPIVKRFVAHAIVLDPKNKKYLIIRNKKHNWDTVIIGGIENGETAREAAEREVREETGYTDLHFIKYLGGPTEAHYYTKHKGENRIAIAQAVLFELKSDARVAIQDGEDTNNEILWIESKDFIPGKMVNSELPIWLDRLNATLEYFPERPGVPCFVDKSLTSAVKEGVPFVERQAIAAIVKHWKEDKYLGIKWKQVDWHSLITGGPEGNQTLEEGAMQEIIEETGYQNPKLVKKLGVVDAKFYHPPKGINRYAHFNCFYFELKNGDRRELSAEESEKHEVVWLTKEEMFDFLTVASQRHMWWSLFLGKPNLIFTEPKKLLDWPESIKEAQRNWIGRSEGAEIPFRLEVKGLRFLLLHGYKSNSKGAWIPWLKGELEKRGYTVEAPDLPNPEDPHEDAQVNYILENCTLDPNTVIIGHSLGGIVAMKALMKSGKKVSSLTLVAPAMDPDYADPAKPKKYWPNFDWHFDWKKINELADGKIGVISDIQEYRIHGREKYIQFLAKNLHAYTLETKAVTEHFCATEEPEVLKFIRPNLSVFTTRPDTMYGVTYLVLAPEHMWVSELVGHLENRDQVQAYIDKTKQKSDIDRTDTSKEKTGIQLKGLVAINPANGEEIPVWIADYVLADYGTGAVMAVPAHDERDWDFAKKYGLPIKFVIKAPSEDKPFIKYGEIVKSGSFTGKKSEEIMKSITEAAGGKWVTKYKLRDWVFSRQRYWGEPIPVIHCENCGVVPVPEKDLPVKLPKVKYYEPTGTGESPLAAIEDWVNVDCPQCHGRSDEQKTKYFVFDFDGVLGDTWKETLKTAVQVGNYKTEDDAKKMLMEYFDKKPHHARGMTRTPEQIAEDAQLTEDFGKALLKHEPKLFVDFVKEIKKFKNVRMSVVSSGSHVYVKTLAKKSGLKFDHVLAFEDSTSKEEKLEHIARDWKVSTKDVYYFTDTKADVYELENTLDRNKIIGCSWGFHGREKLMEVLPEEQIIDEFHHVHNLFKPFRARRETNTMPQWAGSSWYYLRYMDPQNKKALVDPKREKYWAPVDLYVGGAEHATRHLIYARFWHKFLYDIGVVSTIEPFKKLQNVGLIMGEDGRKMSKRFGNVINPDDIVKNFGADTLRVYEMFMGPFDQQIAWSTDGMVGARRFIERVWKLAAKVSDVKDKGTARNDSANKILHKTIKKVTEDIQALRFNTAISALMIATNELDKMESVSRDQFEIILKLLAPFAPHMTEELWSELGNKKSIHISDWPEYDPALLFEDEVTIIVQVNGKVRSSFKAAKTESKENLEKVARELPEVKKWLEGKSIQKTIIVEGRLVSFVVG